jgi:putative membrane protein insertion efficiency factor
MKLWRRSEHVCSVYIGKKIETVLSRTITVMSLLVIGFYRVAISGLLGSNCRFKPTCSHYAEIAFKTHPPTTAFKLTITRILKCHPFGPIGFDPVPEYRGHLEKK